MLSRESPFRLPPRALRSSIAAALPFLAISLCAALPPLPFPVLDDHDPAVTIDSAGALWVVWVSSFADTCSAGAGDAICAARWTGSEWDTSTVSEARGRYLDPQIAATEDGFFVAWVALAGFNSDVKIRRFAGGWSAECDLTDSPEADFAPALCAAGGGGGLWLAWQSWTGDSYDIRLARLEADSVVETHVVADGPANDGEPDVAVAPDGTVWIAWASVRDRHEEICLRFLAAGVLQEPLLATSSQKAWSRYPSLGVDPEGDVWIAYYHLNRTWKYFESHQPEPRDLGSIRVLRWDGLRLAVPLGTPSGCGQAPRPLMEEVGYFVPGDPVRIYGYRPSLLLDGHGRIWVFSKMNGYLTEDGVRNLYWGVFGVYYEDCAWSEVPRIFLAEGAHFWNAPAAALDGAGTLWLAWTKDGRGTEPIRGPENILGPDSDVRVDTFTVGFGAGCAAAATGLHVPGPWTPGVPREVPRFQVETADKTYDIYWGENHRHTCDFSYDGIWDYPFEETFAETFERVGYDWIAPADHVEWWSPLVWNLVSKWVDLRYLPGRLVTFPGYERSGRCQQWGRHGDQNALYRSTSDWQSRDARLDTALYWPLFYSGLDGKDVLVIPHHTAERAGCGYTLWEELLPDGTDTLPDPLRLVEIFQTTRGSSEYPGCPLQHCPPVVDPDTGWVHSAWSMGLRLGVAAAGDHNPGNGFTAVLAEGGTREALFEALRERRCYGTSYSRKIFLDFRVDDHLMGEEIEAEGPPAIAYRVVGTDTLARVCVVKNGDPEWHVSTPAGSRRDSAWFVDPDPFVPGTSAYYYLRVEQVDSGMAWSSPVWVDFSVETGVAESAEITGQDGRVVASPLPYDPSRGPLRLSVPPSVAAPCALRVYSLGGRLVRELVVPSGRRVAWDGRYEGGRDVPPGLYFLRVDGGGRGTRCPKLILVR
ncbi:MAG: hypothetical protein ABIH26_04525 [Candidatus Eisenbacteria bacterium]